MEATAVKVRRTGGLSAAAAADLVAVLKAVADPARLQIIEILRSRPDLEACVCDFPDRLGLSQPTVSHHLKVLAAVGVVTRERRGSWAWFQLDPARLQQVAALLTREA